MFVLTLTHDLFQFVIVMLLSQHGTCTSSGAHAFIVNHSICFIWFIFAVLTGEFQCYLYCCRRTWSQGAGSQGAGSSAAGSGSQESCFLEKQGSSSTSSHSNAHSVGGAGICASYCMCVAWAGWQGGYTYTLCAESLWVSTASPGDGEGWRQACSFSFADCQPLYMADSVHAEDLR